MIEEKQNFMKLFESLNKDNQVLAYDFIQFLIQRQGSFDFEEWERNLPIDDEPLTEEEKRQLADNTGFVDWEEAKKELRLSRIYRK